MKTRTEMIEEWNHSLEGIRYRLGGVYGGTTLKDDQDEELICLVLQKLPEDVRDTVLVSPVTFILAANQYGTVFRMRFHPPPGQDYLDHDFILLTLRGSKKSKMTTIAHEIAHFYLQRNNEYGPGSSVSGEGAVDCERVADDLIETWGFDRAYDSYKQFKKK